MANVNVYVPDEMKARMAAAGDVNWSAAAQRAFETELRDMSWKERKDVIEQAVERLRASRERQREADERSGASGGREWALTRAEDRELERLDRAETAGTTGEDAGQVFLTIAGGDSSDYDARDVAEFWGLACGMAEPSDAMVQGFVKGALEVWEEVAPQI